MKLPVFANIWHYSAVYLGTVPALRQAPALEQALRWNSPCFGTGPSCIFYRAGAFKIAE